MFAANQKNNKMKTAMQELIDRLDKTEKQLDKENNLVMSSALFAAKSMALDSLKKEKEQIIDAHINGQSDHHFSLESRTAEAEEYYNKFINKNK